MENRGEGDGHRNENGEHSLKVTKISFPKARQKSTSLLWLSPTYLRRSDGLNRFSQDAKTILELGDGCQAYMCHRYIFFKKHVAQSLYWGCRRVGNKHEHEYVHSIKAVRTGF